MGTQYVRSNSAVTVTHVILGVGHAVSLTYEHVAASATYPIGNVLSISMSERTGLDWITPDSPTEYETTFSFIPTYSADILLSLDSYD